MGGGKGSISHYVTPVKAGRIIVEVGGAVDFEEVSHFLQSLVWKMPLDAMVINSNTLELLYKEKLKKDALNINPINFKSMIRRNMLGSQHLYSSYDYDWSGVYI